MGIAIGCNLFCRPFVANGTPILAPELVDNVPSVVSFTRDVIIAPVDVFSFFAGSQFFVTLSSGTLPAGILFDGRFLTGEATIPTPGQAVSFTASNSLGNSTLTLLLEVTSPSWDFGLNTGRNFEIRKSVGNNAPPALVGLDQLQFQIGE